MGTYEGWSNYETWAVNLWLENDEGSYRYWCDRAKALYDEHGKDAANLLAEQFQEELEEQAPDLGASLYSDLFKPVKKARAR